MNENKCWKGKLWSDSFGKLPLAFWASRRRQELLELLDRMNPTIEDQEATGSIATDDASWGGSSHCIGFCADHRDTRTFWLCQTDLQLRGVDPSKDSSGGRQRLGHLTKQGSSLLRFLLVGAAQAAVRCNADWQRRYRHLAMRRQRNIAKVAMGRRLGARLYWMWRNGREYSPSLEFGSHAGESSESVMVGSRTPTK